MVADETMVKNRQLTAEMIGRTASVSIQPFLTKTVDFTQVNYTFWSRFRRGKAVGYELGGLFAQPIGKITQAWTLGRGFRYTTGDDELDGVLNGELVQKNMDVLLDWFYDGTTLGDSYVVVNPDLSLTLVPPNQMEVVTDPLDYRKIVAYKITTILDKVRITDEYRLDGRTVTIKAVDNTEVFEYQNLIGMFPVIHLAWDKESNEVYGHPIYEALLTLFAEYDDVIRKALQGVKLMGNPIPVIEGAEDPEGEIERLMSDDNTQWVNENGGGTTQSRNTIDLNSNEMLVLGMGAKFKFAGPGSFTQDAGNMLEYLFLLMLQHSKIPEWAWGGAIASSKASVDSQMPACLLFIESVQTKLTKLLIKLAEVWLAMRRLVTVESGVVEVNVAWNPLTDKDETIVQNWVKLLYGAGLIQKQTAVRHSGLVADPQEEVDAAMAEMESAGDEFDQRVNRELALAG